MAVAYVLLHKNRLVKDVVGGRILKGWGDLYVTFGIGIRSQDYKRPVDMYRKKGSLQTLTAC